MLYENLVAVLDTENGILEAFQFDEHPDGFSLGALNSRFIDALRLQYDFGNLVMGESREVSFSVLVHAFEFEEAQRWTAAEVKQRFEAQANLPVEGRDFSTYIQEYDVKFVVVDTQQVVSNIEATPALDKIYDNGRIVVYTTKR